MTRGKYYGTESVRLVVVDDIIDSIPSNNTFWRRHMLATCRRCALPPIPGLSFFDMLPHWVRGLLKRYRKMELALAELQATAQTKHSHIILLRDDTYWIDDFHLVHFPDPSTVYSPPRVGLCSMWRGSKHAFARPQRRKQKRSKIDLTKMAGDQVLVMNGEAAQLFFTPYTEYRSWGPSSDIPAIPPMVNAENYLNNLAVSKGLRWQVVRADWFPYLLAIHIKRSSSQGSSCQRKLDPKRMVDMSSRSLAYERPQFCLRGYRKYVDEPVGPCMPPSLLQHPLCGDLTSEPGLR